MPQLRPQDATGSFHGEARPDGAARRIVSLVPSTTETLADLGVGERVVGRTRYCVHPRPWVDGVPGVGGTKDPDPARIAALSPDLIVANREENKPDHFDALAAIAPLWVAYPRDVDGALADVLALAELAGAAETGRALVEDIAARRAELAGTLSGRPPFRYAYLVWRRPWMAVNDDTFIAALLAEAGGRNAFGTHADRYPTLTEEDLAAADPDVVFLPDEPYRFAEEHVAELGALAPRAKLVDGELLSWHGSRLRAAFPYLAGVVPG